MRILGYPPGWLKKADMSNTTIKLFDGFENDQQDGLFNFEFILKFFIILIFNLDKIQYNTDSFFEYPGFNIPLPKNIKDVII